MLSNRSNTKPITSDYIAFNLSYWGGLALHMVAMKNAYAEF